jgi:hypothetical protein
MTDLKPCPFCGGKAEQFAGCRTDFFLTVYCTDCLAEIKAEPDGKADDAGWSKAVEKWNRRVNE